MKKSELKQLIKECISVYLNEARMSVNDADNIFKKFNITGASKLSLSDLNKAYKQLSMKHHPDKGGNEDDMKNINNAYESLKNAKSGNQQSNQQNNTQTDYSEWPSVEDMKKFDSYSDDKKREWYKNLNPRWKSQWDKKHNYGKQQQQPNGQPQKPPTDYKNIINNGTSSVNASMKANNAANADYVNNATGNWAGWVKSQGKKLCTQCNAAVSPNSKFCSNCRSPIV